MSQQHVHFLAVITSPIWQQGPGSSILIELGPVARAAVDAACERLRQQPAGAQSIDLAQAELRDFSVRQVTVDGLDRLSGGVVGRFEQQARKSEGPIALPGDKMKHVLLLTDEFDELEVGELAVSQQGTLQVGVTLADVLGGCFRVKGSIELDKLADD